MIFWFLINLKEKENPTVIYFLFRLSIWDSILLEVNGGVLKSSEGHVAKWVLLRVRGVIHVDRLIIDDSNGTEFFCELRLEMSTRN